MDKYEFNVKVEQIKKMVTKGDYETAMKIADTIDWRRVRNVNILTMAATIYEKNEEYREAKDILLEAFERAPIGKRLLYKLAELAIKEGNTQEAEDYYREFCELAEDDPRQFILRYLILGAKGAPVEQLIHTLEQYCNVELDEKWMYELAELYNEAGMGELCVMTCDKIMLMFGIGKYVDKAMELKIQYAPLTKEQMDLVENRDHYEARLKAVEQEYREEPRFSERKDPEEYVRSVGQRQEARQEEEDLEPVEESAPQEDSYAAAQEPAVSVEPEYEEEPEIRYDADQEEAYEPEEEPQQAFAVEEPEPEPVREPETMPNDALKVQMQEAAVQRKLAEELSRLSQEEEPEESGDRFAGSPTKVLPNIHGLARGPLYSGAGHLMIETSEPEEGLNLAIQRLRELHRAEGTKNQAAKITGEKLNRRGIFTISDKLTGKDLIIEQAGDMNEAILQELNTLMSRDETGMNVVLIDTPERLEKLHKSYPGLARRFEIISRPAAATSAGTGAAPEREKAPRPTVVPAPVKTEAAPSGAAAAPVRAAAAPVKTVPSKAAAAPAKTAPAPVRTTARPSVVSAPAAAEEPRRPAEKPAAAPSVRPAQEALKMAETVPESGEMDIDEFAQYACKYAASIDCSISGKSMLALYERIEMMEEDNIPLTRENAEELIETAADKAENPSLGKRITGMFASKYDRDGLLILKEEHFI